MTDAQKPKPDTKALLQQAALEMRRLRGAYAQLEARAHSPIAVVGMAGRFPGGGNTLDAYWDLLAQGRDAVGDITPRWDALGLRHLHRDTAPQWAALLDSVDQFDAPFFGMSAREADRLDPQQRLLLELSYEALEHAGMPLPSLQGSRTSVYVGALFHDYELRLLNAQQHADFHSATGAYNTFAAGRLSYVLGLQGPCLSLDTACSSSLVSIHLACQSLRSGESSLALACGVNLILAPEVMDMLSAMQALSPDGRCKTFDARANGYVRGEGGGVLVLKRLADAQRDGDRVLALIRGSAVNQDGASTALTSPSAAAQVQVLQQALANAQLTAEDIDCIEAHGTGTSLGDPLEMEALRQVFAGRRAPLPVGSVKTNVGHLESAAGMSGVFKIILAMQHNLLPAHRNFETLNPVISLQDTPFVIPTQPQPWPRAARPRRAGVSAFAMSGTNAHVILEEPPEIHETHETPETPGTPETDRLLALSAKHPEALRAQAAQMAAFLRGTAEPEIDLAASSLRRRTHHALRLAVVGQSKSDWAAALQAFAAGTPHPQIFAGAQPASTRRDPVWVFPGQGAQWLGMGRTLMAQDAAFAAAFAAAANAVRAQQGPDIAAEMQASAPRLEAIEVVQPWLFCVQLGLAALWRAWGVTPGAVVGHSMGEAAAAVVAGALSLEDGARVITLRSRLMQQVAGQGAMLAVNMSAEEASERLRPYGDALNVAVFNGPQSVAISGPVDAIERLQKELTAEQQFAARVRTNVAFHSPHMDALNAPLLDGLADLRPRAAELPLYSTVTGSAQTTPQDAAYWGRNLRQPVLFAGAVQALKRAGFDTFLEISPHPLLTHALSAAAVSAVHSTRRDLPERATLLGQLATLHTLGVPIDWAKFAPHGRTLALPPTPYVRQRHWLPAAPQASLGAPRSATTHPLLGSAVTLANGTMAWERELGLTAHPWLEDHRVGEARVVPGAVYVEMLLAAARDALGTAQLRLESLELRAVLVLQPEAPVLLQVVREAHGAMLVCSRQGTQWTTHASARVLKAAPEAVSVPPLSQEGQSLDATAAYQRLATLDLHYGPAFQGIAQAWVQPHTAHARLRAPERGPYTLAPTLLDAALQVAGLQVLCTRQTSASAPWLPMGMERLSLLGNAASATQCWVQRTAETPTAWTGDVVLLDAQDRAVVHLQGVRLQQMASGAAPSNALLLHTWEKLAPLPQAPRSAQGECWLIVGDTQGLGLAVQKSLAAQAAEVIYLTPEAHAAAHISDAKPLRGIVYLAALDAPTGAAGLARAQALTCDAPLKLLAALQNRRWRDMPRLWLVTQGAQQVHNEAAPVAPEQALLWGLGRSLAYELPQLRCTRLDVRAGVSGVSGVANLESTAHALVRELLAAGPEDELALRGSTRYAARLQRGAPMAPSAATLRRDGTYLITGGLGGLGLQLAAWMAQQGAGHLLLCGRRATPSPQQQAVLTRLQEGGTQVHLVQVDSTDAQQMAAVIARTDLPPLRGVVHTAGVLDDALASEQTPERFFRVLAPKVLGAWNLHTLTAQAPLDFFVLYASAAGLLGAPAQTNYAAANSFLDALATLRRQQGLPALSIDWGPFAEVGMAAAQDNRGNRLVSRGLTPLTPEEGHGLLAALLHSPNAHVGALHMNTRQWLESFPHLAAASLFTYLVRDAKGSPKTDTNMRSKLQQAPAAERAGMLQTFLAQEIASVLRLDIAQVGRDVPLKSLGVDSLLGLELRNRLEAGLGVRLSATLVWVHPTPGALQTLLEKELNLHAAADPPAREPTPAPAPAGAKADTALKTNAELEAELEAELALGAQLGGPRA